MQWPQHAYTRSACLLALEHPTMSLPPLPPLTIHGCCLHIRSQRPVAAGRLRILDEQEAPKVFLAAPLTTSRPCFAHGGRGGFVEHKVAVGGVKAYLEQGKIALLWLSGGGSEVLVAFVSTKRFHVVVFIAVAFDGDGVELFCLGERVDFFDKVSSFFVFSTDEKVDAVEEAGEDEECKLECSPLPCSTF